MVEPILQVKDLQVSFNTYAGKIQAIRGVDFDLNAGETLAIVGESGSGKSVTTKTLLGLNAENAELGENSQILYGGKNLAKLTEKEWEDYRGSEVAMVFQDPMTSLDPTMKIGNQIAEPIMKHHGVEKADALKRALQLMKDVGIPEAEEHINDYPHQWSGGMRQRAVIAIALAAEPKVLIADEPTTALDVTIQAQILRVLKDLQEKNGTAIIFITHDLGVVAGIADRVAVMYAGKIVETGTVNEVFYNPQHPYTWGLLGSMPSTKTESGTLQAIPGTPPDLLYPPKGDAFANRNPYGLEIDHEKQPPLFKVSDTHYAATWLLDERAPKVEPPLEIQRRQAFWQTLQQEGAR
ncbi:oligopeptide ABC transporter, ATP-binding protein [Fructobacillus pseudoficulneus]|uniref:Oligopeptide ABC transporter, ATP-binding protein n=1 Tax=Fructobacillus pseudoficulneus TaxID=220714 RepID=A0A3F3H4C2_9LACO|nr:ABC transporter ATP-binding protein [Fructobacillus pseudoficulneus]GAP03198.1 oligopeptide ABC transporter, ATP-binding protein [Fructobacillus pseudoficulneus]SEH42613.1 oligopeptide transport system ATP-binding protein [Fructobacillus pseudoficulneus]